MPSEPRDYFFWSLYIKDSIFSPRLQTYSHYLFNVGGYLVVCGFREIDSFILNFTFCEQERALWFLIQHGGIIFWDSMLPTPYSHSLSTAVSNERSKHQRLCCKGNGIEIQVTFIFSSNYSLLKNTNYIYFKKSSHFN